jgi:hypothetical protein
MLLFIKKITRHNAYNLNSKIDRLTYIHTKHTHQTYNKTEETKQKNMSQCIEQNMGQNMVHNMEFPSQNNKRYACN